MKQKLLLKFFLIFLLLSVQLTKGQNYTPLVITSGFNEDVIAEDSPASTHTTAAIDATSSGANNAFMSINYPGATVGLPVNGLITSIATGTPGLTFQLASYNQNNSLKINANNGTGTLAVQTTKKLIKLYILATSGSDLSTFTGTITFTDATTQTFVSQFVPDWYDQGTPAITIRGIGRVPRTGTQNPDNNTTNPKLFQVAIDISSTNQNKIIQQVAITKTSSTSGFLNIFALSGEITPTCIKPDALGIQNLTATSVDLTWTSPGTTFDIKWGERNFNVTTAGTLVTGFANGGTLSGLTADTNYDYYVRRDCGAVDGVSAWAGPFQFRTGYCIPTGATNNSDEIRNFKLSNLNNNSTASEGTAGYKDYSGTVEPAILEIGEAYVASLTSGSGSGTHGAAIWIDYNNNLIFEANEKVSIIGNTISSSTTVNFPSFTVPATIQPGIYRLRVQYQHNKSGADLDPCTITSIYAETEDYAVQIMPAPTCFPPLNVTAQRITKNSAQVVWEAPILGNPPALGYKIEVRTSGRPGDATGLVQTLTTTNLSQTITGLSVETEYLIYVQTLCATTDESTWSRIAFTTLCNHPDYELTTSASDLSFCGSREVTLEVNTQGTVNWFNSATSTTPIHTGNTYTTTVSATSSFWYQVSSLESATVPIGPLNAAAVSTSSGNWGTEWDVYFTILEPTKLKSIDIYPSTAGQTGRMTFKQRGATGSATVGTINYTTVGANRTVKQVVPIDLQLLPGTYVIETTLPSDGMLRNTSGASYPYSSAVASITGNEYLPSYYMGYYNWIFETGCTSPRTEVVATVTDVPTFTLSETELILCKGTSSSAVTIASGAVSNADYTWLPATGVSGDAQKGWIFNPSVSTTYQLTASVNGCELTQDVVVQVIDIALTSSQTNIKCHGGSTGTVTVHVSGGTLPYTYAWDTNQIQTDKTAVNLVAGTYTVTITDKNGCTIDQKFTITEPTALSVTPEQTDIKCQGASTGIAAVTVTGGVAPYTYAWDNGATTASIDQLAAGSYTVTITDKNGCTIDQKFTITEPTALSVVPSQTDIKCHGGSTGTAAVTVTGGTLPYTYAWDTNPIQTDKTAVNLVAGTYTVTITDKNGCTIDQKFTITEPTALSVTPEQTDIKCQGASTGKAAVTVTGGTLPYTYAWDNGATTASIDQLAAGSYTVTITDKNGCTIDQKFTITEPTALSVTPEQTDVLCHGASTGKASVVVSGGVTPYSYSWDNGVTSTTNEATDLLAGTYKVTVTDANGCTITETFTITEPTALGITTSQTNVLCYGASTGKANVVVSGGVAPYSYSWDNGVTSTTNEATDLLAGTYKVTVTDANGCTITKTFTITEPTALTTTATQTNVSCYGGTDGSAAVNVSGGVTPYSYSWSNGAASSAVQGLTAGIYLVTITDANGCIQTQTIAITEPALVTAPSSFQSTQNFCKDENKALVNLNITGTNIQWYDSPTGGTALSLNTLLTSKTYYASQTVNGCESPSRKAITVNIYEALPLTSSSVTVCYNSVIQEVSIDGRPSGELKWYMNSSDTKALNPTQLLTSGTYYVSTFVHNLCESPRRAVQVTVLAAVPLPGTSQQVVCGSGTVADLTAQSISGAVLKWYATAQSSTPLAPTTNLLNGTYYVEQEVNGCRSGRKAVAVRVVSLPAPSMTNFVLCEGATVDNLQMPPTSVNYVWFADATTSIMLPGHHTLTTGYYYVAYESLGCISKRTRVHVKINVRPVAPTGAIRQHFTTKSMVSNIKVNESNVVWYASYEDAVSGTSPFSNQHPLEDRTTYYGVLVSKEGCTSYPLAVQVTVTLGLNDFDLASLKYYPNPVTSELTVTYKDVIEQLDVYDLTGKWVKTQTYTSNLVKMNLYDLAMGTYMVRIKTHQGEQFIKIVKK